MVPPAQQEQVQSLLVVQVALEDGPRGVADRAGVVQLAAAGLIVQGPSDRYRLTPSGRSLGTALDPLDAWSKRWARSRPDL